jgi:hypothetical protein
MNEYPQSPWPPNTVGSQSATHRIVDEYHQGMVVATIEHPQEWRAQSKLVWNFQDTSWPVMCYASVFNPRGAEAVEFLPVESFFWIDPPIIYTPGQKYRGQTCLPPMGALDAVTQFALPKYRGHRQNLRIMYTQPIPNLAQVLQPGWMTNVRNEGIMARLEYEENGQQFEEDYFACVMWHTPNGEQLNWGIARHFTLRAARGQLDAARPKLWPVATSLQNNPQWGQLFQQIMGQLHNQFMSQHAAWNAQNEGTKAWGQQMREYREWESDLNRQVVNDRWASQEKTSDRMGDVLGGHQRFHDPNSAFGVHYDKSLSQYSWTNGHRWIHTNEVMYNPNTDPNESTNGPWTLRDPIR